jgi:hypothetical protein
MTSIGDYAFTDCSDLKSVTIGNNVISIGYEAFLHCFSLTALTFEGKTLVTVQGMRNYSWGIEDTSIIKVAD